MLYSRTTCPVENADKEWIGKSMRWFEQHLGKDFIKNRQQLIPADCRFDYAQFDSHEAIQYFITFICSYIDFDDTIIEYKLFWKDDDADSPVNLDAGNNDNSIPPGHFIESNGKYMLSIDESQLYDFDMAFLNLVSDIVYIKLFHEKIFTFSNIYMGDYAIVLYGFGILMANVFVRTAQWQGVNYSAWEVKRFGSLNPRTYGYLFAVLSKHRSEADPAWAKYLHPDVKNFYNQSIKFLEENETEVPAMVKNEEVFIEKQFYENGSIRIWAHRINEKYEGLMTFYYENGMLWSERIYKNGTPYSVLSNYNPYDEAVEKGTLHEGNGTLYIYKRNGNLDRIETYRDGKNISST